MVSPVVELDGEGWRGVGTAFHTARTGVNNCNVVELLARAVRAGFCRWGKLGN
jgi:hypothetical protein